MRQKVKFLAFFWAGIFLLLAAPSHGQFNDTHLPSLQRVAVDIEKIDALMRGAMDAVPITVKRLLEQTKQERQISEFFLGEMLSWLGWERERLEIREAQMRALIGGAVIGPASIYERQVHAAELELQRIPGRLKAIDRAKAEVEAIGKFHRP